DDLDRLALGAVLGVPLAPVEPAVDRDRAALGEVLRAALALVPPDGDVEVVRLVAPLAGLAVLLPRVHGEAQLADRGAARRVPQLGVLGQVSDQDDAVDVGHYSVSSPALSGALSVSASCRSTAATATGSSGVGSGGRAVLPTTRRTARGRMTPSVIFNTREISSSVAGSAAKVSRW